MTHYYMSSSDPTAIITSHNSERKLYQGNTVYLNDGDNFEIRLFNPLREKVGVEIRFNGLKKSNQLLVLNPGQDYILDRFIEEQRKMVFDTYLIDGDNSAAVSAASQNGKVEILFYKEKQIKHNQDYWFPHTCGTSPVYGGRTRGIVGNKSNIKYKSTSDTSNMRSFAGGDYSLNDTYYTDNMILCSATLNESENLLETGRIEKGDVSNQRFREVQVEFETYAFHTVCYWLKPASTMPRNTKQIRHHCPGCGIKIKDTFNFCPKCGFNLNTI